MLDSKFFYDKSFDIYSHFKCNIKCNLGVCEIHDSMLNIYCFNCKRSICEVCKESFHSEHNNMEKAMINFNPKNLDLIFEELEQLIDSTEVFSNPDKLRRDLKKSINDEFSLLHSKINELKESRLKEIDKTFSNSNEDATKLRKYIKTSKDILSSFFNKNTQFFFGDAISDDDNFIFLQVYEIYHDGIRSVNQYIEIIKNMTAFYSDNKVRQLNKYDYILSSIESAVSEQRENEARCAAYTEIKENLIEDIGIKDRSEDLIKFDDHTIADEDEKVVVKKFLAQNKHKLETNLFESLYNKAETLQQHIEDFRKGVYDSFIKNGSLVEIEKLLKLFEEKTVKRLNFTQNSQNMLNSKTKTSLQSSKAALTRSKANIHVAKKETNGGTKQIISPSNNQPKNFTEKPIEIISPTKRLSLTVPNKSPLSDGEDFGNERRCSFAKKINDHELKKNMLAKNIFTLVEKDEDSEDNLCTQRNKRRSSLIEDKESMHSSESDSLFDSNNMTKISVKFEKNQRDNNKVYKKLNDMFRPKPKLVFSKVKAENSKDLKESYNDEERFKVNNKLVELIKENQRLTSMIKKQEDISLAITTIRRYFTFSLLELAKKVNNLTQKDTFINAIEGSTLKDSNSLEDHVVKVQEGSNEIVIYDREKSKMRKIQVNFDKKKLGCSNFLSGCRIYYAQDKIFISGGKDINGDKKLFLVYSIKDNSLSRLPDMCYARSYHTTIFHESLKSLLVFGGENNVSCEMFDFYLNMWNKIPELNVPRANASIYIDKIGTFAYIISGIVGNISSSLYSDAIEYLDLIDMNQGWVKLELNNKANVDLKTSESRIFPLTESKFLIYGPSESRNSNRCYVVLDLKRNELIKIEKDEIEKIKVKVKLHPDISQIFK